MDYVAIRTALLEKDFVTAATLFGFKVTTKHDGARAAVAGIQKLLCSGMYSEAASILWGPEQFHQGPEFVQRLWRNAAGQNKLLVLGAGSTSKSYSLGVYLLLDWLRDPMYTNIKIVSLNVQHCEANLFSHIVGLHQNAVIPLIGKPKTRYIGLDDRIDKRTGISVIGVPEGSSKARLRGYKPYPRSGQSHPLFGRLSRLRIFLDEAECIPEHVWDDVGNLLLSSDGKETIKIFAATNPKDSTSQFAKLSEPQEGWQKFALDRNEWTSRRDWRCVWLDASQSENVVQKKVVYPGIQTYEGYLNAISTYGGTDSVGFWCMCRGMYAPQGAVTSIIPMDYIRASKGEWVFQGNTVPCAAVDLAHKGNDKVVFTYGKHGVAVAYRDEKGKTHEIKPVHALQIEGQFEIDKGAVANTVKITDKITHYCDTLGVKGEWLAMDTTGMGVGFRDYAIENWQDGILAVNYAEKSSDKKVLAEDAQTANELYYGVTTEMWYAGRRWMEVGAIRISSNVPERCESELVSRRAVDKGKGVQLRVESKDDYKARNNPSPDYADSFLMLVHLVRLRGGWLPGIISEVVEEPEVTDFQSAWRSGVTDKLLNLEDDTRENTNSGALDLVTSDKEKEGIW